MVASATPARAPSDAFPGERLAALVRRFPAYARLAWRLGRDERLSRGRRAAVVGAAAYLASPVDLVPGIIPLAGQLDDAAVALVGLRFALAGLPVAARDEHLAAAGIEAADLDRDLSTVWMGTGWLLRRGGRIGLRVGRGMGRAAVAGARAAIGRIR
ncbi:MAG TPA: YkvA family protein [Candidatus Limnocylindria bacterium]|nr:YkvA family protein [Candidatus Limnocylindria bacterium]